EVHDGNENAKTGGKTQHPHGAGGARPAAMIRKLSSGGYRLYSRKVNPKTGRRRNLGTFKTRAAAEKHEHAVEYFKRHGGCEPSAASAPPGRSSDPRAAHARELIAAPDVEGQAQHIKGGGHA